MGWRARNEQPVAEPAAGHEVHAAKARELLNTKITSMGGTTGMIVQHRLLAANAQATLALYELLRNRPGDAWGCVPGHGPNPVGGLDT